MLPSPFPRTLRAIPIKMLLKDADHNCDVSILDNIDIDITIAIILPTIFLKEFSTPLNDLAISAVDLNTLLIAFKAIRIWIAIHKNPNKLDTPSPLMIPVKDSLMFTIAPRIPSMFIPFIASPIFCSKDSINETKPLLVPLSIASLAPVKILAIPLNNPELMSLSPRSSIADTILSIIAQTCGPKRIRTPPIAPNIGLRPSFQSLRATLNNRFATLAVFWKMTARTPKKLN